MEKINIMEILKGAKEGDMFMNFFGTKFVFKGGNLIAEGGCFDGKNITDMYRLKDVAYMIFYKVSETNSYSEEDLPYGIPKKITFINGKQKVYFRIKMNGKDVWGIIDEERKCVSTSFRLKGLRWENVLKVGDYI